jgi:hypothetical protein
MIAAYTTRDCELDFSAPSGFSLKYNDLVGQILLNGSIPGDFDNDGWTKPLRGGIVGRALRG